MKILPEEFQLLMKEKLGNEYPEFVASLNQVPPTSIRLNPKKYNPWMLEAQPIAWTDFGKYLPSRPSFTMDPLFHAGTYYVQEASSMFLEQALRQNVDLNRSINVLDLCAAPGGKSTHIIGLINYKSLLVSNEVIRSRASVLAENLQKWGYSNSVVTNNDPKEFQSVPGFFDVIVIDAPCSGEGLFRKDPEAIDEWSPHHVEHCSSRQKRIIADVWPALKENGILIYSTCTYNEKENENNLNWLAEEHTVEFLKIKTKKEWGIEEVIKGNAVGYRLFPHRVEGEGFFLSMMIKKENAVPQRIKPKKNSTIPSKKIIETVAGWIDPAAEIKFLQHQDWIYFLPANKLDEIDFLRQHLKVITAGTTIAALKHDKIIPEHALAMSVFLQKDHLKIIPVDRDQAIQYLRRDVLNVNNAERGHHLITYKNIPLGWINGLGNRFNNLYPLEWRIRMAVH